MGQVDVISLGEASYPKDRLVTRGPTLPALYNLFYLYLLRLPLTASAWINQERLTLPLLLGGLLVIAGTWFGALWAAPSPEAAAAG